MSGSLVGGGGGGSSSSEDGTTIDLVSSPAYAIGGSRSGAVINEHANKASGVVSINLIDSDDEGQAVIPQVSRKRKRTQQPKPSDEERSNSTTEVIELSEDEDDEVSATKVTRPVGSGNVQMENSEAFDKMSETGFIKCPIWCVSFDFMRVGCGRKEKERKGGAGGRLD
jgi:hypothetical protein